MQTGEEKMSYIKVKEYLEKKGYKDRIVVHEKETDTVENAARELGITKAEIAKTMSFLIGELPIVIVMTGDVKVSNSKYKAYFKTKAKMVPWDSVEEIIGHEPGGVCPFAVNEGVKVYLDESLKKFKRVWAAGRSMTATVGLDIPELEDLTNNEAWIDVTELKG